MESRNPWSQTSLRSHLRFVTLGSRTAQGLDRWSIVGRATGTSVTISKSSKSFFFGFSICFAFASGSHFSGVQHKHLSDRLQCFRTANGSPHARMAFIQKKRQAGTCGRHARLVSLPKVYDLDQQFIHKASVHGTHFAPGDKARSVRCL